MLQVFEGRDVAANIEFESSRLLVQFNSSNCPRDVGVSVLVPVSPEAQEIVLGAERNWRDNHASSAA